MKILLTTILLISSSISFSQNCEGFYYSQNNKTIEMTQTNKKGKESGKIVYTISDVKKSGSNYSSTVTMEIVDTKGEVNNKAINVMQCNGGVMKMDLKMFIPSAQQEQMGTAASADAEGYLDYPGNMNVGDLLNDGSFSMDFKMQSGISANVSVQITNRKVEAKESVTTSAGTWNCFKITYNSKKKLKSLSVRSKDRAARRSQTRL